MAKTIFHSLFSTVMVLCLLQSADPAQAALLTSQLFTSRTPQVLRPVTDPAYFTEKAIVTRLINFKVKAQDRTFLLSIAALARRFRIIHERYPHLQRPVMPPFEVFYSARPPQTLPVVLGPGGVFVGDTEPRQIASAQVFNPTSFYGDTRARMVRGFVYGFLRDYAAQHPPSILDRLMGHHSGLGWTALCNTGIFSRSYPVDFKIAIDEALRYLVDHPRLRMEGSIVPSSLLRALASIRPASLGEGRALPFYTVLRREASTDAQDAEPLFSSLRNAAGVQPIDQQTVHSLGTNPERLIEKWNAAGFDLGTNLSKQTALIRLYEGVQGRFLLDNDERRPYQDTLRAIRRSFLTHEDLGVPDVSGVEFHVSRSPDLLVIDDWSLCTTVLRQGTLHVYLHVNLLHAIQSFNPNPEKGVPYARATVEKFARLLAPELLDPHDTSNPFTVESLAHALAAHELHGVKFLHDHPDNSDVDFHANFSTWAQENRRAQLALTVVAMAAVSEGDAFLHDPRQDTHFERFKRTFRDVLEKVFERRGITDEVLKEKIREYFFNVAHIFRYPILYKTDSGFLKGLVGDRAVHMHRDIVGAGKGGIRFHIKHVLDEALMLMGRMLFKNAGLTLKPHGGAKGGVGVDPVTLSLWERLRVCAGWLLGGVAVAGPSYIGVETDVPAPDVNTGAIEVTAILETHLLFLFTHGLMPEPFQSELEKPKDRLLREHGEKILLDGERVFYFDAEKTQWYRPDELGDLGRRDAKARDRLDTYVVPASEGPPRKQQLPLLNYKKREREELLRNPIILACMEIAGASDVPLPMPFLGAITGKSVDQGGSEGRIASTGRGGADVIDMFIEYLHQVLPQYLRDHPEKARALERLNSIVQKREREEPITVSFHGFGNAALPAAMRFYELKYASGKPKYHIDAISDLKFGKGTLISPNGINIGQLKDHLAGGGRFDDFEQRRGSFVEGGPLRVLTDSCDVLMLAVGQDFIVASGADPKRGQVNARDVKSIIQGELANGPVADPGEGEESADEILAAQGSVAVPGELLNRGGAGVSVSEEDQDTKGQFLSEEEVFVYLTHELRANFDPMMEEANGDFLHLRRAFTFVAADKLVQKILDYEKNHTKEPRVSPYEELTGVGEVLESILLHAEQEFTFGSVLGDMPPLSSLMADRILHWLYSHGILKLLTRRGVNGLPEQVYVVSDAVRWIQSLRTPSNEQFSTTRSRVLLAGSA